VALAVLPGCGKRGDPLPPLPTTPQPVRELRLAQRGGDLEVTYVAPRLTTGGVRLPVLEVELLRMDGDGDFDKLARPEVRRVAPGETLTERLPLPAAGTTVRIAVRARSRGQVSPRSTVVSLPVQAPLEPPRALQARVTPEGVALAWEGTVPPPLPSPSPSPSPSPGSSPSPGASPSPSAAPPAGVKQPPTAEAVKPAQPASAASPSPSPSPTPTPRPPARGFRVYRRTPAGTEGPALGAEPSPEKAFVDRTVQPGQEWCYVVRSAASTEPVVESAPSPEVCVSVKDVVPPAAPAGLAALVGDAAIELSWSPSGEADLAVYRVYRSVGDGAPQRLAEVPAGTTEVKDPAPGRGGPHHYTVTAVDRAGNESPPSTAVEAHLP
jgi:hypothetical protein